VGSLDNNVYAINAINGVKIWNYTTGSFIFSSPAVVNGVLYIGSLDNNVYALGASPNTASTPKITSTTIYVTIIIAAIVTSISIVFLIKKKRAKI